MPHQHNYLSLPLNEDLQPIEIQLQNYKQKRDIDFKLIVLLILIIMLGILIRKEQQQLEIQGEVLMKLSQNDYIGDGMTTSGTQFNNQQEKYIQNKLQQDQNALYINDNNNKPTINNEISLQQQNKSPNKNNQIKNYFNQHDTNLDRHRKGHISTSGQNYHHYNQQKQSYQQQSLSRKFSTTNRLYKGHQFVGNYKSQRKIQLQGVKDGKDIYVSSNQDADQHNMHNVQIISTNNINTPVTTTTTNTHSKLLKKYIEFYLWFPFFIFALIVYSCYQKQSTQSSILISVKTLGEQCQSQQQLDQCAICITEINYNDPLAVLPCSQKHAFHSRCIKEWLLQKKTCPICRSDVRRFIKNGLR